MKKSLTVVHNPGLTKVEYRFTATSGVLYRVYAPCDITNSSTGEVEHLSKCSATKAYLDE